MSELLRQLQHKLLQRQSQGLLRTTRSFSKVDATRLELDGRTYRNFASNDYLGIGSDSNEIASPTSKSSGALASPLVVGHNQIHRKLEESLLDWLQAPANHSCLLFSSGYAANLGVIRALFNDKNSNAFLFQDKLNHASLMEAGTTCQAQGSLKQVRFRHNDNSQLNSLLARYQASESPSLVVTEGVFSMDGDTPDLVNLTDMVQSFHVPWMLDDAHGIGILGKQGRGSLDAQGLSLSDCDILVVTFGKAMGAQGAAVIASRDIIDYLINFSKEYIYSTHLSPVQTQSVLDNLSIVKQDQWRRDRLNANIHYFRAHLDSSRCELMTSVSPIQPLLVNDEASAMALAEQLKTAGIWAGAMRYPTVAKGAARVRVTITAKHSKEDLDALLECLNA